MTPNETRRLLNLQAKVEAAHSVSGLVKLTDANVRLMRKATQEAIAAGRGTPEMLKLAKSMGLVR